MFESLSLYPKRQEYYYNSRYDITSELFNLFERVHIRKGPVSRTSKIITPKEAEFSNDLKTVKRHLRKPVKIFNYSENFENYKIASYRYNFNHLKANAQYHFFKNNLFLYCISFPEMTSLRETAIQTLFQKYTDSYDHPSNTLILDNDNNAIICHNGVTLEFYYLSSDFQLHKELVREYNTTLKKTDRESYVSSRLKQLL